MAAFPFEGVRDFADAINATLSILRLAVPYGPAQALDLRDSLRSPSPSPNCSPIIRWQPALRAASAWRYETNRESAAS
jgi:hypothetical protein